jgi:predicted transcriptional regulator
LAYAIAEYYHVLIIFATMNKSIYTNEHRVLIRKLVKARVEAGLTQQDVAKKLQTTQSYVSKLESGQRKIDLIVMKKLAKIYRKSITEFV